jgi:hypothetical protein
MKTKLAIPAVAISGITLAVLLASPRATAQETGVSHPEALSDKITAAPVPQAQTAAKPTPYVPYADVYVPGQNSPAPATTTTPVPASTPAAAETAVPASTPQLHERELPTDPLLTPEPAAAVHLANPEMVVTDDPTSGVVLEPVSGPNELPIATMLHTSLSQTISTRETATGTRFTAVLVADVLKHGRVMIPAGSTISGRVTQVHSGRRVTGPAAIRLQPDIIKLTNGMAYELEADVIDLEHYKGAHVNQEGAIIGNGNTKVNAATFGATTGSGALIGAAVGGGVGAVVGAGIGAGVGTVIWLQRDHQETLASGTGIVFSLNHPLEITPL